MERSHTEIAAPSFAEPATKAQALVVITDESASDKAFETAAAIATLNTHKPNLAVYRDVLERARNGDEAAAHAAQLSVGSLHGLVEYALANLEEIPMRKIALVALMLLGACSSKDAGTYHNDLMTVINDNEQYMQQMNTAMSKSSWSDAESVREKWSKSVDDQLARVTKEGPFDGDASFQQSVLAALGDVKTVLANDYKQLIEARAKGGDAANDDKLLNKINSALEGLANRTNSASADFQKKHAG